ncbi:MAG: hypothetical protein EA412_10720 [Chitinophagaceae bacterium]|nr:MAG: hypothetical protein EA412_10720 [Chitinophagaceae bacterium]
MFEKLKKGDKKTFVKKVKPEDVAAFESGRVHDVYATFALARDAEWCCRLFVIDCKKEDEEGIGTKLNIEHSAPAFIGESVSFTAEVDTIKGNELICTFEAYVGKRLIAKGVQGQKILKKQKINQHFEHLKAQ